MVGKRKQEECILTNEQQEKFKSSTTMKAIYGMYPVLPSPRKNVEKGYY